MNEDVDALALASRNAHNKTGEQNLWRVVLALPAWYFIAQGEGDQAEPMVASVDGKAQLLAFTEEGRAEAFARHIAGKRGGAQPGLLEMDVAEAVRYARELESLNVQAILFNSGEHAFACSMTRLWDMHSRSARQ